jgi:cell fate regulator YaaT (PSP1 superfamily)
MEKQTSTTIKTHGCKHSKIRSHFLKDEKQVHVAVQQCIEKHKLDMKLIKTSIQEDGGKTTVFYTADGRVDFRELLKTLAATLHCRIEMRQIGARNAAKLLGGIGICGRPVCCTCFLSDFEPVSLRVSRRAGCCHDPSRLTGICGKLRCCHTYEPFAEGADLIEIAEILPEEKLEG